jgi:hypothetical protein
MATGMSLTHSLKQSEVCRMRWISVKIMKKHIEKLNMVCRSWGYHSIKKPLDRNVMYQQTLISVKVIKEFRRSGQFSFEEFPSLPLTSWMSRILLCVNEINLILKTGCRPFSVQSRQFLLTQQPFNPSLTSVLSLAHSICRTRVRTRY